MRIQCHMVTGDNWRTARVIAEQLAISNIMAEVLPSGKAARIQVCVVVCVVVLVMVCACIIRGMCVCLLCSQGVCWCM